MFEDDEWDLGRLALWMLVGVVGFSFFMSAARPDTESTSQWPAPAQLDERDQPDREPSVRPGTSGWTPPWYLQRAVQPRQTEGARLPSGFPDR